MSHNPHATQPPARKRRCRCPQPGHQHGCHLRYNATGGSCRCPQCRNAHSRRRAHNQSVFFANRLVPSLGTARRLQALAVAGWPPAQLAARLGVHLRMVERWRDGDYQTTETRNAKRIAALCAELWDQTPTGPPECVSRVRHTAERKGWAPFAAWDDIDNPDDQPHGTGPDGRRTGLDPVTVERLVSGWLTDATLEEVDAAVARLTALGVSVRGIAAHLEISAPRVQRAQARARARLEVAA